MSGGGGWSDAHCHLQEFTPPRGEGLAEVLRRAEVFGVRRFVVNGTGPGDWAAVARLAATCSGVVPQFGLHPWQADCGSDWETPLKEYLLRFPQAGLGEIGLDLQLTEVPLEVQREVFGKQLALAARLQRPCTIHAVGEVWDVLLEDVRTHRPPSVLLHAWGGGATRVGAWMEVDARFSFGGAVCREPRGKAVTMAVETVPLDRLMLETDAPWQHPRGQAYRQEPAFLLAVAEQVSRIKGVTLDTLRAVTEKNVDRLFGGKSAGDVAGGNAGRG